MNQQQSEQVAQPQDKIAFLRIEPRLIDSVFDRCREFIESSFSANAPSYDIEDVKSSLETGEAQLWIAIGRGKILAGAITMITVEPKAKTLAILNLGGTEIRSWIKELDISLTAFAKENGCHYIEAVTRRGFSHFVPDFIEDGIVYIKRVGTIQ